MNVEGKELRMTKLDGHQRRQKTKNDGELSRDAGKQVQVVIKNVLAAETYLAAEKFPIAGIKGRSVNADEAELVQRIQSSCDLKEKGKEKITRRVRLQGKGR